MRMCAEYSLRYKKVESDGVAERSLVFPAGDPASAQVLARYHARTIAAGGHVSGVFAVVSLDDPSLLDLRFELSESEIAPVSESVLV